MAQTTESSKGEMLGWFASKFGAFLANDMMRNIIGQTKSGFNLRDIMDNKKILLVNLSKGRTGELNSQLLGMIFVMKFNAAAMGRADMPEDQRQDFSLYVDEFQNFATDSFATILSEARKYRLSLILANQFMTQLTDQIREAIAGKASGKGEGEGQADAEEIRRQVTREVMEKANQRLIGAAVTAEAASLLRDPSDAARYLDLTDYHVDENGNVDSDEIRKDIRSLIRDKPYLGVARKGDGSGGGNPDFDGGARSGATGTVSMSDLIRNAAGYGRNRR